MLGTSDYIEQTMFSAEALAKRWDRGKTFVYGEVKAGLLAPADRGRWPLAEVKRYERESYLRCRKAMKAAA